MAAAYMHLDTVTDYLQKSINIENASMINGKLWLPVEYIRLIISPAQFRELECDVTTWVPDESITNDMREAHRQEKAEFELQCGGYDTSGYL